MTAGRVWRKTWKGAIPGLPICRTTSIRTVQWGLQTVYIFLKIHGWIWSRRWKMPPLHGKIQKTPTNAESYFMIRSLGPDARKSRGFWGNFLKRCTGMISRCTCSRSFCLVPARFTARRHWRGGENRMGKSCLRYIS